MTEPEDKILVQRALQANPESFGELCRRYYNSLLAVANSILSDQHLAEDAAQEAIAAACRQLPRLKKPQRFGPWIITICRNIARDMLRESRKQPKFFEIRQENEPGCERDEQKAILTEALEQLPQHLREVVFLRFYNEKSYEQMANILGVTEQTIDGRIRRAKKKIAVYLKKVGFRR